MTISHLERKDFIWITGYEARSGETKTKHKMEVGIEAEAMTET